MGRPPLRNTGKGTEVELVVSNDRRQTVRYLAEITATVHMILKSDLKMARASARCIPHLLAHLSQRLMVMGELIVYQSLRRPSVHQHFQTSFSLKPLGHLNSTFIWRFLRTRERKFVQMDLVT